MKVKKKVVVTVGTRPEVVKMAPLVHALRQRQGLDVLLVSTSQHRQMLDQALDVFGLVPDHDLNIMKPGQSLCALTARALDGMGGLLEELNPDFLLVQGDTNTVLAAALAAHYHKVPVGHVEAGLRTNDPYLPFPEEMNRRLTSRLCALHFAPTRRAADNLIREGVPQDDVYLTGNTVIDALFWTKDHYPHSLPKCAEACLARGHKFILVTAHRRESLQGHIFGIMQALKEIAESFDDIEIIYPVHLNPRVQEAAYSILEHVDRVHLIEPVPYPEMVNLMDRCYLVLTDSGGIQEEAPTFGKPVLVLREVTERPEAVEAGVARLVGVKPERIVSETARLLESQTEYDKMAVSANPFGDGKASKRIAEMVLKRLGQ